MVVTLSSRLCLNHHVEQMSVFPRGVLGTIRIPKIVFYSRLDNRAIVCSARYWHIAPTHHVFLVPFQYTLQQTSRQDFRGDSGQPCSDWAALADVAAVTRCSGHFERCLQAKQARMATSAGVTIELICPHSFIRTRSASHLLDWCRGGNRKVVRHWAVNAAWHS